MPYMGAHANLALKVARDGISNFLNNNTAKMSDDDQNQLLDDITKIDQKRTAIATMGVIDAVDPHGKLLPKLDQATQCAKTSLDKIASTEAAIQKALTIAGDVVRLATSIAAMDVNGFATSLNTLITDTH